MSSWSFPVKGACVINLVLSGRAIQIVFTGSFVDDAHVVEQLCGVVAGFYQIVEVIVVDKDRVN